MYILDDILKQSVSAGASDIHFSVGRPPYYRIDGVLSPAGEEPLMPRELSDLLLGILDEAHRQELGQTGQTDLAYAISGVGRFRVNISGRGERTRRPCAVCLLRSLTRTVCTFRPRYRG